MEYIRVIYFNVEFDMLAETENDIYKIDYLTGRVDRGELINMWEMASWCRKQDIKFRTHFSYRIEFPITANLWNFYIYCRFKLENFKLDKSMLRCGINFYIMVLVQQ